MELIVSHFLVTEIYGELETYTCISVFLSEQMRMRTILSGTLAVKCFSPSPQRRHCSGVEQQLFHRQLAAVPKGTVITISCFFFFFFFLSLINVINYDIN